MGAFLCYYHVFILVCSYYVHATCLTENCECSWLRSLVGVVFTHCTLYKRLAEEETEHAAWSW